MRIRLPYSSREHHDGSAGKDFAKMELSSTEGLAAYPQTFQSYHRARRGRREDKNSL